MIRMKNVRDDKMKIRSVRRIEATSLSAVMVNTESAFTILVVNWASAIQQPNRYPSHFTSNILGTCFTKSP